jgi:hypothetical protein
VHAGTVRLVIDPILDGVSVRPDRAGQGAVGRSHPGPERPQRLLASAVSIAVVTSDAAREWNLLPGRTRRQTYRRAARGEAPTDPTVAAAAQQWAKWIMSEESPVRGRLRPLLFIADLVWNAIMLGGTPTTDDRSNPWLHHRARQVLRVTETTD